jgi:predicted RNA binding protein YcfA (HicA-like mRNA interferase family)
VIRLIEVDGWQKVVTEGSHRQYKHPAKPGRVTISGHPGDEMPKGTLASVKRQAGLKRGRKSLSANTWYESIETKTATGELPFPTYLAALQQGGRSTPRCNESSVPSRCTFAAYARTASVYPPHDTVPSRREERVAR